MAAEAAIADEPGPGGASGALLNNRFVILASQPLPAFTTPAADAFGVEDLGKEGDDLFALVGEPDLPPRAKEIEALADFDHPHVMRLVDSGMVALSAGQPLHPVFVYVHPRGGSFVIGERVRPTTEQEIRLVVVPQVCSALEALHSRGVFHRAIRPDNLFFADEAGQRLIVGDCLSGVPGQCQPVAFEPLERAFAPTLGRGTGGEETDLYALGVTILALLLGRIPGEGSSDEDLLNARLERGSYVAMCKKARFSQKIEELLRGLLADPIAARWGLAELQQWVKRHRVAPNTVPRQERKSKPFDFIGRKCSTPRALAVAMNENWSDAAPVIQSGRLESWLISALNASALASAVEARRHEASGGYSAKRISLDEMVARVCISLDPDGPIRYKGVSVALDGIGPLLAGAMVEGRDRPVQTIASIIAMGLPIAWLETKPERRKASAAKIAHYIRLKQYLNSGALGFGIERCLYELNPGLRCFTKLATPPLSHDLSSLLRGLNAGDGGAGRSGDWIDRHVGGFIGAAIHPIFDSRLAELRLPRNPEFQRAYLGLVLLTFAQRASMCGPLVNLARAMRKSLAATLDGLHSRTIRSDMLARFDRLIEKGDLALIHDLLGDEEAWSYDAQCYKAAVDGYAKAEVGIRRLRTDRSQRAARAARLGYRLAARIAYAALAATVVLISMGYVN
ncbi:MAG: hypothetical protein ACE5LF_06985 [Alphaproteobacteria bacterium]